MHTSVSIIDYLNDRKIFLVFIEEDFNSIKEVWNKRNSFDQEFKNITNIRHNKMSSVCLIDWKLLIIQILKVVLQLPSFEHNNIENPNIKNMHNILVGFCYKYKLETGNNLDYLQISNFKDNEYSFNITSSDLTLTTDISNET